MRCIPVVRSAGPSAVRSLKVASTLLAPFILVLITSGVLAAQNSVAIQATPLAVQNGSAQLAGPYNPQQMLRLAFALKPPYMEEEEEFLRQLQDPNSPQFHQYLSQQQWNERFAPSAQDEQAVVTWAQSQGMTITSRYDNRLLVDVEAPVAVIQKALNVTINAYQISGKNYYSNDRDPVLPASLAPIVNVVFGLNNIEVMHSFSKHKDSLEYPAYSPGPAYSVGTSVRQDGDAAKFAAWVAAKGKSGPAKSGRGNGMYGAYDPPDIYSSYAYNYQALNSLGHCCNPLNNPGNSPPEASVAISISGDYEDSDISGFTGNFGLANNVQRFYIDGTAPCCSPEATMDTEWITATANSFGSSSNTAKVYVYVSSSWAFSAMLDGVNRAAQDGHARVLNMSWGAAENNGFSQHWMDSYHAAFNQMVGEGWTIVAAAGDAGSTTDCTTVSVSYPASDPDVTAVGGTTLSTSQGTYNYENAWTGGSYGCTNNDGGGGGGCSAHFSAPSYQQPRACSNGKRSVPDVALNSDWLNTPQNIVYEGYWYQNGGTSIAAPEMSGFIAQENAYLLYLKSLIGNTCGSNNNAPCAPVGSVNPDLYWIGHSQALPHLPFYDITQGCNNNDITDQYHLTYYCAARGYDRVTGWGSVNMFQLAAGINFLLAGDYSGPSVSLSGPPVQHWYNSDQTVSWTLTDTSFNGHQPIGVAGATAAWDVDPGDVYSEPTPGGGSSYYGPQTYGASGSLNGLTNLSQGCHTAYVRSWDNAGFSSLATYGPLCLDTGSPTVSITVAGNQQPDGGYNGPALVTVNASDSGSGIALVTYSVDGGPYLTYSSPFYIYSPGYHWVYAFAYDNVGIAQNVFAAVTIDQNQQFTLSVIKSGSGHGTVTSTDHGINCGSVCSAPYYDEQPVTLTAAPAQGSIFTGWRNCDLSFGFSCTATVTAARNVTAVFNLPVALQFVPLTPCRVVDTRLPNGPFGGPSIAGGASRDFALPAGSCPNIPSNAAAYSLNVTTVPHGYLAYLSAWPTGFTRPQTSIMNSFDGRIKANAAILPAGDSSSVSVFASNAADVVLDIDGYFIAPSGSTLAFFPLTPCRVIDTRNANGPLGGPTLQKNQPREFPVLQASGCGIPASGAAAYSFNVTVVPANQQEVSYLTVWPSGLQQPVVSTLNALTGTITANAAIVPAGTGGDISVYPAGNDTDLVVDINGYFAAPASGQHPLSLYTFNPCRVLDTRQSGGAFDGQITVGVENSACEVPGAAQAYNMNATALPSGALGFLTLWPDGQSRPVASTLNALDGAVTSNMAIVPTSNGSIDAYAAGLTQLLFDISSYFAP